MLYNVYSPLRTTNRLFRSFNARRKNLNAITNVCQSFEFIRMLSSGFADAPVTKAFIFYLAISALLISLTDNRHWLWVEVDRHLWTYGQWWRLLVWPFAYLNSTEVLMAVWCVYQLRVVERLWGGRKTAVCVN
jgi:hypothetical protein